MAGALIGALRVTLGIDTAAFEQGLSGAQKNLATAGQRMQAVGDRMAGVGKGLSVAVTAPLVLLGKTAFDAANNASDAIGQVESALASMGPVAGKTSEQLQQGAKDLEKLSSFDDKEILRSVTANLLTFGNIAGEQFDRAQLAAVDLATRLGTDLQSATILVGKALNDPVKGLTAMGRAGIQFSEDQKVMIKSMVAAGDQAGAQAIILGELEKQFGGAGKAARDAAPGSDAINKWSDLKETVGAFIQTIAARLEPVVNSILDAFNNLSPGTQNMVLGFAAVAAAIGPVLVILGTLVSSVGALLPVFAPVVALFGSAGLTGVISALGAVLAPFLAPIAAVAAVGALIYANWDKIAPVLEGLRKKFVETLGPKLQSLIDTIRVSLLVLWKGPLGQMIRVVIDVLGELGAAFAMYLGERLIAIISAAVSAIEAGFNIVLDVVDIVIGVLTGDFSKAWNGLTSLVGNVITGVVNIFKSLFPETAKVIADLAKGFATWFGKIASDMITMGRNIIDGLVRGILAAPEAVWNALKSVVLRGVENIREFLGIASPSKLFMEIGGFVSEGMALGITGGLPKVEAAMDALGSTVADRLGAMTPGQGLTIDAAFDGEAVGNAAAEAGDRMRDTFSRTFADGIKAALDGDLGGFLEKTFSGILDNAMRGATDVLSEALTGLLGGLFGGTGQGGGGGLTGLLGGALGGLFKGSPGFALGGNFTVGGRPGRDANLVAFRATRGEHVEISRAEAQGARSSFGMALGTSVSAPVNITIDATGADAAAIARLDTKLEQMRAELRSTIVRTVQDATDRRMIRAGAR
ncbi:MAG: phage tail length tape measure family protein [Erythrobacter sp.]|nr:phage tail length tape measure family protein [Erythrobacter sp.]MDZ4274243.1 phage tail length tape measure family protein [Erythrobacter sp.]